MAYQEPRPLRPLVPRLQPGQTLQPSPLPGVSTVLSDAEPQPEPKDGRKYGKRLTTKEEVSLFTICNKYASDFGKRSNLCKWWRKVAAEFTATHDRSYSWHSVRRTVDTTTKQRIKFLEERARGSLFLTQESVNPAWCAVLDTWLPTWKQRAEADAARILRRNGVVDRRNKRIEARLGATGVGEENDMRGSGSSDTPETDLAQRGLLDGMDAENTGDTPDTATEGTAAQFGSPSPSTTPGVRLPPGFDTMFSSMTSTSQTSPPVQASMPDAFDSNIQRGLTESDSRVPNTAERSQSVISTDQQTFENDVSGLQGSRDVGSADITQIKEDLRREMRIEWRLEMERSRVAFEEKLDSVQKTQEMILEMLRQGHA